MRQFVILLTLLLLLCVGVNYSYQQSSNNTIELLYSSRNRIKLCLNDVERQLKDISLTKRSLSAVFSASAIVQSHPEITGYSGEEIISVKNNTQQQLDDISAFEKELFVKQNLLKSSLAVIDNTIANKHAYTYPTSRFAYIYYGTLTLGMDGELRYNGHHISNDVSSGNLVMASSYPNGVKDLLIPIRSVIGNATVVTEVISHGIHSQSNSFTIKTSDGKMYGWGQNYLYQLGVGPHTNSEVREVDFSMIESSTPLMKKILCQDVYCLYLSEKGEMYSTGFNPLFTRNYFLISPGEVVARPIKIPIIRQGVNLTVVDFAFTTDANPINTIYSSSNPLNGQWVNWHTRDYNTRNIDAGRYTLCILASDFKIYCIGGNAWGQLGDGTMTNRVGTKFSDMSTKWEPINSTVLFTKIFGGNHHFAALSVEGIVYTWGRHGSVDSHIFPAIGVYDPALGRTFTANNVKILPGPIISPPNFRVVDICYISDSDTLILNQNREAFIIGTYQTVTYETPFQLREFKGKRVKHCSAGSPRIVVMEDGTIYAKEGLIAPPPYSPLYTHPSSGTFVQIEVSHPFY